MPLVLNNKIIEKKECKDYKITYCRIPINRYNQNKIIEYLKEENIRYYQSNEIEKFEHFKNIKYTSLVVVIIFDLIYIIPLFIIYFLTAESLLFIISYITSNLEVYKLYFIQLSSIFLLFILLYLVIYYILLKLNNRKLTI